MDDISENQWVYIPGFSGYRANALGEIRGLRRRGCDGRVLTPHVDRGGYPCVTLYGDNGVRKTFRVHNVIALVFHGPRPEGLVTRHLDGDQMNNVPSNLAYGTYSENAFDQVAHGKHAEATKERCVNGHPLTEENLLKERPGSKSYHRRCKECHRVNIANYRARKKAQGA